MTSDTNFAAVVDRCAEPRAYADSTWITSEMRAAYCLLHELGWAHSIEIYPQGSGELVGGRTPTRTRG